MPIDIPIEGDGEDNQKPDFASSNEEIFRFSEEVPRLDETVGSMYEEELNKSKIDNEVKEYLTKLDDFHYENLVQEFSDFTKLPSIYPSINDLIQTIEDETKRGVPYYERFRELSPQTRLDCYKLEKLCQKILMEYVTSNPKKGLFNKEGKIKKSLPHDIYDSVLIDFDDESGITEKLFNVFTGYALKGLDDLLEFKELTKILYDVEKDKEKIGKVDGILHKVGLATSVGVPATLSALGIISVGDAMLASAMPTIIFGGLNYSDYKKSKIIKDYEKKLNEYYEGKGGRDDLIETILYKSNLIQTNYLGEISRANNAHLGNGGL